MPVDKFGHFLEKYKRKHEALYPHLGFYIDDDKNFNLSYRRIKNVADPIEDGDIVNKQFIESVVNAVYSDLSIDIIAIRKEIANLQEAYAQALKQQMETKTAKIDNIGETLYASLMEKSERFSKSNAGIHSGKKWEDLLMLLSGLQDIKLLFKQM